MIKTVCFDLDGTLINSEPIITRSFDYTFKKNLTEGIEKDLSGYRKYIGPSLEQSFSLFTDDEVLKRNTINTYLDFYKEHEMEYINAFANAYNTLEELKKRKINLVLLSTKLIESATPSLTKFKLYDLFDKFITHDDLLDEPKPNPKGIFMACESFHSMPNEILMVGDTEVDILCGKNAGSKTALVNFNPWFKDAKKTKPDYIISDLIQIINIISEEK